MKFRASLFLLLLMAAPALADSVSILSAPSKPQFIDYPIPSGTAILQPVVKLNGHIRWVISGQASDSLYTFTFNFDHTQDPSGFFSGYLSFAGNGVNFVGGLIQAHFNGSVLSGGWTGAGSLHGRFTLLFSNGGKGCSTNPSAVCLTLDSGTFSVATTPEPASVLMMGTGLIGLATMMRRKLTRML